jgi:hypothetical protein
VRALPLHFRVTRSGGFDSDHALDEANALVNLFVPARCSSAPD